MNDLQAEEVKRIDAKLRTHHPFTEHELTEAILTLQKNLESQLKPIERSYTYFNLGLLYGELTFKHKTGNEFDWIQEELEQQISYYWKALHAFEQHENPSETLKPQKAAIYANIANVFSNIGRCVEAITFYKKALCISPCDPQHIGNVGMCLRMYAWQLHDPNHKKIMLTIATEKLASSIGNTEVSEVAKICFEKELKKIPDGYKNPAIFEYITGSLSEKYPMGVSKEEKDYRHWSLQNNLFLHPLNDLGNYCVAARDVMHLPDFQISPDEHTRGKHTQLIEITNNIKDEFVSAKVQYFEGIKTQDTHYSSIDNLLIDTLDNVSIGLGINKVKLAFKSAYSVLDKIGHFINTYFNLPITNKRKEHTITFKTVWYEDYNLKDTLFDEFKTSKNLALRGLFFLSKDLSIKPNEHRIALDPDALIMSNIRNCLEHKYLAVHNEGIHDFSSNPWPRISRLEFERRTLELLTTVRASIIYLLLAVHNHEVATKKNANIAVIKQTPIGKLST